MGTDTTPGKLIAEAREAAGLTQDALADMVGLSASMISRIEADKVAIKPDVFRRLTGALRALSAVELLNAMGYEVAVPSAQRLPTQLVRDLLALSPEELDAVALLVQRRARRSGPRGDQQ